MRENRSREYQSSVSGDSPVGRQRSKFRLAGETQRARTSGIDRVALLVAQNPISSSWLPNDWRRRTREITNTERQRGLRSVNCRLGVVTGRKRGGEIRFRTFDLGICAQPLLVGFEHGVECAL